MNGEAMERHGVVAARLLSEDHQRVHHPLGRLDLSITAGIKEVVANSASPKVFPMTYHSGKVYVYIVWRRESVNCGSTEEKKKGYKVYKSRSVTRLSIVIQTAYSFYWPLYRIYTPYA